MSVSDIDYASWLTKQQAADAIGVTTKTVERLVQAGQIQQGRYQPQGRGPVLAVYQPDDVARIARERRTAPSAFVLPVGVTPPVNGNGHSSPDGLQVATPELTSSGQDLLRAFAVALRQMSETSETSTALFLSIAEAATLSGLSRAFVRRLIEEQKLPAVKDGRSWRVRRRDLEAL